MTIYQLECFIAVAEELNFSAAAERLFTTQPAITYQINALEKETGLHLFERTTRRTKLTAAGQSFYLDMVQMTSFGRQALKKAQDIQDADRSHLTVGLRQLFDYSTFSSILAQFQHHRCSRFLRSFLCCLLRCDQALLPGRRQVRHQGNGSRKLGARCHHLL